MPEPGHPDPDRGLTHVALGVTDIERSIAFYEKFAAMRVVHDRVDPRDGTRVVWLSDLTRPFVVVLVAVETSMPMGGLAHLGVACASRAQVDERCAAARRAGLRVAGPSDSGPPVGYWAFVVDPDGHNLELSFGQEVAFAVEQGGPI